MWPAACPVFESTRMEARMWITWEQFAFAMAWLAIAGACGGFITYMEARLKRGDENKIHFTQTRTQATGEAERLLGRGAGGLD